MKIKVHYVYQCIEAWLIKVTHETPELCYGELCAYVYITLLPHLFKCETDLLFL